MALQFTLAQRSSTGFRFWWHDLLTTTAAQWYERQQRHEGGRTESPGLYLNLKLNRVAWARAWSHGRDVSFQCDQGGLLVPLGSDQKKAPP